MQDIEIHAHLWYVKESKELLDKVAVRFNDRINISLVKDSEGNKEILSHAKSKFKSVQVVYVDNMGNDQVGFIESYKINTEDKPWILYVHDKKNVKWTNELIDPILDCKNLEGLINENAVGMIGSEKKIKAAETEEYLAKRDAELPFEQKLDIVKYRQTVTWLRELQYILYTEFGFQVEAKEDFQFFAGTMFLARKNVIRLTHSCIHDSFFEPHYRNNGRVEHGIERFYGYVNKCLHLEMRAI